MQLFATKIHSSLLFTNLLVICCLLTDWDSPWWWWHAWSPCATCWPPTSDWGGTCNTQCSAFMWPLLEEFQFTTNVKQDWSISLVQGSLYLYTFFNDGKISICKMWAARDQVYWRFELNPDTEFYLFKIN